ncbi:hypothetical protein GQ457_13G022060 [Hibiscus cannabinus]
MCYVGENWLTCPMYIMQEQMHRGTMTSLRRSDAVPEGTESVIWIMIEGGVTPLHTPEEHKAMGFHLIVHPLTALYASARALVVVLETLKENRTTRDHLHNNGSI